MGEVSLRVMCEIIVGKKLFKQPERTAYKVTSGERTGLYHGLGFYRTPNRWQKSSTVKKLKPSTLYPKGLTDGGWHVLSTRKGAEAFLEYFICDRDYSIRKVKIKGTMYKFKFLIIGNREYVGYAASHIKFQD